MDFSENSYFCSEYDDLTGRRIEKGFKKISKDILMDESVEAGIVWQEKSIVIAITLSWL